MSNPPDWTKDIKTGGRPAKYPLRTMELYEVFSLTPDLLPPSGYQGFKIMLTNRGSALKRKFVSRQLEDGTVEVCRMK